VKVSELLLVCLLLLTCIVDLSTLPLNFFSLFLEQLIFKMSKLSKNSKSQKVV